MRAGQVEHTRTVLHPRRECASADAFGTLSATPPMLRSMSVSAGIHRTAACVVLSLSRRDLRAVGFVDSSICGIVQCFCADMLDANPHHDGTLHLLPKIMMGPSTGSPGGRGRRWFRAIGALPAVPSPPSRELPSHATARAAATDANAHRRRGS
jgi:hypothetical protein